MCTLVAIVDDELPFLQAIENALTEDGYRTLPIHVTAEQSIEDIVRRVKDAEVVLLDEELAQPRNPLKRGELVRRALLNAGFEGKFISTTNGTTPEWGKAHYKSKLTLPSGHRSAKEELIKLVESSSAKPVTQPISSF